MQTDGRYEKLTKKERIKLDRERQGLDKTLSGIKGMNRLPDSVFVIDVRKEEIAVAEANKLGIPVIAVVDTNCSPEGVDYIIPANDAALADGDLLATRTADAVLKAKQMLTEGGATAETEETAEAEAPRAEGGTPPADEQAASEAEPATASNGDLSQSETEEE